ncbi:MAG: hypothetical protein A2086_01815 [Spirochaetes bacterium GWD1_27_9]|nr:MAG: hypothetical protein A2Z98_09775 [Spirochaetes bacterium GWB1_27_13]OHD25665.1 MAG: hypothetical protein A2Y34_02230 [Spirochaetes bacterium GWC1_27_15]OHD41600.1 MAG: hypothetical protein A2086_01815 [Spirochaetes bacterium GWD1_27_9]
MKKITIFIMLTFILTVITAQQTVSVGVEPFPPMINEDGTGFTIDLLHEIEKVSDFKFDIKIYPYNRAKIELSLGTLDLIGHTPYKVETEEFYQYAQEIDWNIPTITDIYVKNKNNLNKIDKLKKIGIPRGNKEFASSVTGIKIEQFYEGEINSLLKMLSTGRIDAFWFERVSSMTTLKKLGITDIYFKQLPTQKISIGLAVKKDDKGDKLRKKLEDSLKKIDQNKVFAAYYEYANLPEIGKFLIK